MLASVRMNHGTVRCAFAMKCVGKEPEGRKILIFSSWQTEGYSRKITRKNIYRMQTDIGSIITGLYKEANMPNKTEGKQW